MDEASNDGLEEVPDKPLDPCKESVDVGGGRMEDSMLPDPIEEDFPPSRYEPPDVSFGLDKDDLGEDKKNLVWYLFILG